MLADIFDSRQERARQGFLNILRTAESRDAIAHHLLGISSDTTAKMFGLETFKRVSVERVEPMKAAGHITEEAVQEEEAEHHRLVDRLSEQCAHALECNDRFPEEERAQILKALKDYFREVPLLKSEIRALDREARVEGIATAAASSVGAALALGAAVNYTHMGSEISAGRTSPNIYLENRPELEEELTASCAAEEKERAFEAGAHEISQKVESDSTADQEATIQYSAANVENCVTGKALQEHLANQEQQKMLGTGLIGGLSGIFGFFAGLGGYQLRKNAQKRAAVEEKLMTLRANPFPSIDAA